MKIQYAHSNHGLFSEDYLDEVLPGREIWSQIEEEAKDAFKQIQKMYSDNRDILNKKLDEDGTEQAFIEKVLDVINPHYLRRPKKSGGSGKSWIPDYALFDNKTKRIEARRRRQEGSNMFKDSLYRFNLWRRYVHTSASSGAHHKSNATLDVTGER